MVSLRKAINVKCRECVYDPYQKGTWRAQVKACTCYRCPLFAMRPLPTVENSPKLDEKTTELAQLESAPIPLAESASIRADLSASLTKGAAS